MRECPAASASRLGFPGCSGRLWVVPLLVFAVLFMLGALLPTRSHHGATAAAQAQSESWNRARVCTPAEILRERAFIR
jgi:hypothetical protein